MVGPGVARGLARGVARGVAWGGRSVATFVNFCPILTGEGGFTHQAFFVYFSSLSLSQQRGGQIYPFSFFGLI